VGEFEMAGSTSDDRSLYVVRIAKAGKIVKYSLIINKT